MTDTHYEVWYSVDSGEPDVCFATSTDKNKILDCVSALLNRRVYKAITVQIFQIVPKNK